MSEFCQWLESLGDDDFWKEGGRPDYKGIQFLWAASLYPSGSMPILAFMDQCWPNPSSFQRWIAKEARRREAGV